MLRPLRGRDLALHALRIVVCGGVIAGSHALVAVMASVALFFAGFALAHDAAHGALGLSRRANAVVLSLAAQVMLVSGHAMRRMHLRHHARPLSEGDLEGAGARQSALGALLGGPRNAFALRVAAFRAARGRERVVQLLETAVSIGIVVAAILTRWSPLVTYVTVAMAMQLSMGLWASHIPHRAPGWIIALCKRLSFVRSPVLLSLAYHERHHRHPGIPCQELGLAQ